jgi:cysteine desulfurase
MEQISKLVWNQSLPEELLDLVRTLEEEYPISDSGRGLKLSFKKIEGESILLMLNHVGVSVSTGSACSSKSLEPSHVLTALGVNEEDIHGTIRFTVGDFTTKEDIDYVLDNLEQIVSRLREISSIK